MKGDLRQSWLRLARCLAVLAIACVALPALAAGGGGDRLHVRHLGIVQGLAQSSGAAIAQDAQGFMWLGTQSGLQRYDGYDFVYYHHVPGQADSLSQDDVRAVAAGRDGAIWVATGHGGLNRLRPDRSGFDHYLHRPDDPRSISSDQLNALLFDRDGRLWVAGNAGVDQMGPDQRFRHFALGANGTAAYKAYALAQDQGGRIWVATTIGLLYVDAHGDTLDHYTPALGSDPAAVAAFANASINCMVQTHDGRLWIGTTDGVFVLGKDFGIERWVRHADNDPDSLASNHVRALLEDANGSIWIGTYGGGLDRLDPAMRGWKVLHARKRADRPDGLASDYVLSLFADASGLVWIGTDGGGFDIYNPRSRAFGEIRHQAGDPASLADDIVWGIEGDGNGGLWVGSQSGLTHFARFHEDGQQYVFGAPAGHADDAEPVFAFYTDPHGALWVGTGAGLFRNQGIGTPFAQVKLPGAGAQNRAPRITGIMPAATGRLWVATSTELLLFDVATDTVVQRALPSANRDALPALVTSMCQTHDGTQWFGTERGLRRLDPAHATFKLPRQGTGVPGVLAGSDVLSCLATPDGDLWVGTTNGLVRFKPGSGWEHAYHIADGLPSETVYSLLRDADGDIWAGTGRGLARVDPVNGLIRTYDRSDGVGNEEFNQLAAYIGDGVLYFGGVHGVTIVAPAHLDAGMAKARVAITAYSTSGRNGDAVVRTPPPSSLDIPYGQNAMTFDVALFDFADPTDNWFRYRLDGFDSSWHTLKDRHSITYTNLDAGSYTLRVQGIDSNGEPSANVATVALDVETAPWLRLWAWLLYVAAACLLAALGLHLFARWIRRRRDFASEQQRRRWAERLHDVVHAVSLLDDERAIAAELVQRLPDLIPHEHAAFFAGSGVGLELVTVRGFAGTAVEALRAWAQTHAAQIGALCSDGRVGRLDDFDATAVGVPAGASFVAIPLNASDDAGRLLLIGRDAGAFGGDELNLVAVLERQVSVVLDKARLIRELETLAHTDGLTGADNRRWFMELAEAAFDRCLHQRQPLSMLLIDVDHFKHVNDTHGHAAGDAVLVELVKRCRSKLRGSDIFGRYGGEEFAVCLPGTTLPVAMEMAERLRGTISAGEFSAAAGVGKVTASFGVACCAPNAGDTLRAMIAAADKALYAAKSAGRNCVRGPAPASKRTE